jgi:hypothetical protein
MGLPSQDSVQLVAAECNRHDVQSSQYSIKLQTS